MIEKLDSKQSAFLQNQLKAIEAEAYKVKYAMALYSYFIPVVSVGAGFEEVGYNQTDSVGQAKFVGSDPNDIPLVNQNTKQFTTPNKHIALGYQYTLYELRNAIRAGLDLDRDRVFDVRKGMEQTTDQVAVVGDEVENVKGILSWAAKYNQYTLPTDGTSSSTKIADKTPEKAVRDICGTVDKIRVVTKDAHFGTQLIIPTEVNTYISSTLMTGTTITIKQFILNIYEGRLKIDSWSKFTNVNLPSAGISNKSVMLAYEKDPSNIKYHIPSPFEQLPPEHESIITRVICTQDIAGVVVPKPKAFCIAIGV